MKRRGYERYGLIGNPFHDLDSESSHDAELFHVDQGFDRTLRRVKEEVFERNRKAAVALVGPLGVGKTERLVVTRGEARRAGAFCAFQQLAPDAAWILGELAQTLLASSRLTRYERWAAKPRWWKALARLRRRAKRRPNPEVAGRVLAQALNANRPAFLLLNDLHAVEELSDADEFLQTLQSLLTHIEPGVMVLLTSYAAPWDRLEERHGALASRFNHIHRIDPLSDDEAALLIAKRLAGRRIVEDLDPLYPFDRDAIHHLAEAAGRIPRELLKLADRALDEAVRGRASRIDPQALGAWLAPDADPNPSPLPPVPQAAADALEPSAPQAATVVPTRVVHAARPDEP